MGLPWSSWLRPVQEEPARVVRKNARAPAQGVLLTPHPGRARHGSPEELEIPRPAPKPPRAHERHHPSCRRAALAPAGRHDGQQCANVNTMANPWLRRAAADYARARRPGSVTAYDVDTDAVLPSNQINHRCSTRRRGAVLPGCGAPRWHASWSVAADLRRLGGAGGTDLVGGGGSRPRQRSRTAIQTWPVCG